MSYTQFTREDRIRLVVLLNEDYLQKDISRLIGKSESSISREINRNKGSDGVYRMNYANKQAKKRQSNRNKERLKIEYNVDLKRYITDKITTENWSPEQIAGELKKENNKKTVICHETIYQWIYTYHKELKKHLRCKKGKYRRKRGAKAKEMRREALKKKRIVTRPVSIDNREEIGHFEGDSIIGSDKKHAITTHVDRKSGYLLAEKVNSRNAKDTRNGIIKRMRTLPKYKRKTETFDNGVEFSDYEIIEKRLGMDIYFAYPYHSWERGTNENTNGLLREYFPKKTNFILVTQRQVQKAVKKLNHRPRKRLGYLTPHEVFVGGKNCTLD